MARKQLVHPRAPWNRWLFCLLLIGFVGSPFLASNTETHAASRTQAEAWPDPLVQQNGIVVRDRVQFEQKRRGEILRLFADNVYGRTPSITLPVRILKTEVEDHALHG